MSRKSTENMNRKEYILRTKGINKIKQNQNTECTPLRQGKTNPTDVDLSTKIPNSVNATDRDEHLNAGDINDPPPSLLNHEENTPLFDQTHEKITSTPLKDSDAGNPPNTTDTILEKNIKGDQNFNNSIDDENDCCLQELPGKNTTPPETPLKFQIKITVTSNHAHKFINIACVIKLLFFGFTMLLSFLFPS